MTKRRTLTDEEITEAARLKSLYEARKAEARARGERLTQAEVGERCGWESGQSAASQYLNGKVPLNLDALIRFAEVLDFDPAEVSPRLAAGINRVRPVALEANVEPGPDVKGRVPLISWVQAGDWCEAIDNFAPGDAEEWLPCPFEHSDTAFCLEVVGLSMSPDYREGEIIAIDPSVDAVHGNDVVCRTPGGNVTFKRLQITPDGTYLLALNPDWPDRMIVIPEGTRICGVVIGSWMRRR